MKESSALTDQYRKASFNTPLTINYAVAGSASYNFAGNIPTNACIMVISSTLNQPVKLSFENKADPSGFAILIPGTTITFDLKANHMAMAAGSPIWSKAATTNVASSGYVYISWIGV